MHKVNMTLPMSELDLIIASLYAKHTDESRRIAARVKMVRDQHKAMFGIKTAR